MASGFDQVGQVERFIKIAWKRMHSATVNYVIRILGYVDLQVTHLAAVTNPTMFMKTSWREGLNLLRGHIQHKCERQLSSI